MMKKFDLDESGCISKEELTRGLKNFPEAQRVFNIRLSEVEDMWDRVYALSDSKQVSSDDFVFAILKIREGTKDIDKMSFDFLFHGIMKEVRMALDHLELMENLVGEDTSEMGMMVEDI